MLIIKVRYYQVVPSEYQKVVISTMQLITANYTGQDASENK